VLFRSWLSGITRLPGTPDHLAQQFTQGTVYADLKRHIAGAFADKFVLWALQVLGTEEEAVPTPPLIPEEQHNVQHEQRHKLLHEHLDELVADWIMRTEKRPSQGTILELMHWSGVQARQPDHEA